MCEMYKIEFSARQLSFCVKKFRRNVPTHIDFALTAGMVEKKFPFSITVNIGKAFTCYTEKKGYEQRNWEWHYMVMHALCFWDVTKTIELTCDEKVRTGVEHDDHADKEIAGREQSAGRLPARVPV